MAELLFVTEGHVADDDPGEAKKGLLSDTLDLCSGTDALHIYLMKQRQFG